MLVSIIISASGGLMLLSHLYFGIGIAYALFLVILMNLDPPGIGIEACVQILLKVVVAWPLNRTKVMFHLEKTPEGNPQLIIRYYLMD